MEYWKRGVVARGSSVDGPACAWFDHLSSHHTSIRPRPHHVRMWPLFLTLAVVPFRVIIRGICQHSALRSPRSHLCLPTLPAPLLPLAVHRSMPTSTCARVGCPVVVRRQPKQRHSERRLSTQAASLARERDLLNDDGHAIVCVRHREEIYGLLHQPSAPPAADAPEPTPTTPSASSSSSSVSEQTPSVEQLSAAIALLSAGHEVGTTHAPPVTARSVRPPREAGVLRALTGNDLEERSQPNRPRGSRRGSRRGSTRKGGADEAGDLALLPLSFMTNLLERTLCSRWDGDEGVRGGRPGCRSLMRVAGSRMNDGNTEIRLLCTGDGCDREVVVSNHLTH